MGGVKNIHIIDAAGLDEKGVMQAVLDALKIEIKVERIWSIN